MLGVQNQAKHGRGRSSTLLLSRSSSSSRTSSSPSSSCGLLSSAVSSASSSISSFCGLPFGLPMSSSASLMFQTVLVVILMLVLLVPPTEQFTGFNGGSLTRTLQTLEGRSCEGGTLTITCPPATIISVLDAKFGRSVPSSQRCAPTPKPGRGAGDDGDRTRRLLPAALRGGGYYGYADAPLERGGQGGGAGGREDGGQVEMVPPRENTNCLAIRSLQVLLDLCEDKVQCQVLVESTTFSQDPCPATSKYLEVHYKCRPSDFKELTVCEGEQMEISCKRALRIAVHSAMFGRVPNGTATCPPNRPGFIDCQSAETVSEVRTACQGRKRCDLQAAEDVFGSPCAAGINKYLSVTYACVPKHVLKELHRHRGRFGPNRKRKKKKKKKKKDKGKHESERGGEPLPPGDQEGGDVTKLTTTVKEGDSDTTSPSGALSASPTTSSQLLETYVHTETDEKTSDRALVAGRATEDSDPSTQPLVTHQPHHPHPQTSTPRAPVVVATTEDSEDTPLFTSSNQGPTTSTSHQDHHLGSDQNQNQGRFNSVEDNTGLVSSSSRDQGQDQHQEVDDLHRDRDNLDPNNRGRDTFEPGLNHNRDQFDQIDPNRNQGLDQFDPANPSGNQNQDGFAPVDPNQNQNWDRDWDLDPTPIPIDRNNRGNQGGSNLNPYSSTTRRNFPENWWERVAPVPSHTTTVKDNSVSAAKPGDRGGKGKVFPGQGGKGRGKDMSSTEATDSGKSSVGISVTEANLTVLCVNHTVVVPTVRTLPNNGEIPIGVVRELFSVVSFVQGHQEKAILYLVLGMCMGLILLLVAVLGRVLYRLKRNSQAKLDMTEPTHSRNVSHLAHHMNHSLLDTPMLEHSDSIDRIEVVRFEPRGTLRSGYHSTLHSDSGDRSLNNYYG